jgi:hypothetical protein
MRVEDRYFGGITRQATQASNRHAVTAARIIHFLRKAMPIICCGFRVAKEIMK